MPDVVDVQRPYDVPYAVLRREAARFRHFGNDDMAQACDAAADILTYLQCGSHVLVARELGRAGGDANPPTYDL